ncbi:MULTISPECIES: O-antigen ligase family protein [Listeria]|uniref:O-antigen ligase family protein n=1 Tax=Listeria TaxID=1637 RepID=UPI000B587BAF|nr:MULTISPECIES: O-antigen ligase family protein [Listeria]
MCKDVIVIKNRPLNVYIFIILTVACPIIDMINGFFLASGTSTPIGMVYRFGYFAFLVLMIIVEKLPKTYYTYLTIFFILGNLLMFCLQGIFLKNSPAWIFADFSVYIKYFLWVLIPYYVYQRREIFKTINFENIFLALGSLLTAELLIPYVLGVGRQTYSTAGAGYKGFFFEQNSISFALIITLTITTHVLIKELQKRWGKKVFFLLLLFAGNVVSLFLLATKTVVVYAVLTVAYLLIRVVFKKHYHSNVQRAFVWLTAMFAVIWIFFRGIQSATELVAGSVTRMQYFYRVYDGDLLRLLFSSRNVFLEGAAKLFFNDPNFAFTLFGGQGFQYRFEKFGRLGVVEMDFFDLFFGMGLIGTALFIFMMLYFIFRAFKRKMKSIYTFALVITLVYIFFVGHVLFSAMSATFLGLICAGIILASSKKDDDGAKLELDQPENNTST